jgi:hypothetical protein
MGRQPRSAQPILPQAGLFFFLFFFFFFPKSQARGIGREERPTMTRGGRRVGQAAARDSEDSEEEGSLSCLLEDVKRAALLGAVCLGMTGLDG